MLAKSAKRVPEHTSDNANERIGRDTEARIAYYTCHQDRIDQRLRELDEEWDNRTCPGDRLFHAHAHRPVAGHWSQPQVVASLSGGAELLPAALALQGWCPPLPLFREAGETGTPDEINEERCAPRAIRGDARRDHRDQAPSRASAHNNK